MSRGVIRDCEASGGYTPPSFTDKDISDGPGYFCACVHRLYPGWEPKVIVELGVYDGRGSRKLAREFPSAQVYSFECNPHVLTNLSEQKFPENVTLVPQAVSSWCGAMSFWVDTKQQAASSRYRLAGTYPWASGHKEEMVTVSCTRLDRYLERQGVEKVDLIMADIQGGELDALKGLGRFMRTVTAMQLEVIHKPIWTDSPLFPELHRYVTRQGFEVEIATAMERVSNWFGDAVYYRPEGVES